MDRFDRIFMVHKMLSGARRPVSMARIREEVECSLATAKRVISDMRLYLNAPIVWDRELRGYRYQSDNGVGPAYELPGLWMSPSEIYALLTMNELLASVQPGFLEDDLAAIQKRVTTILDAKHLGSGELARRVRLLSMAGRRVAEKTFRLVAEAVLRRRRLRIGYHSRSGDESTERMISPQRLVHYRDSWYTDAWCHRRRGLRTFALERIRSVEILDQDTEDVAEERLNRHFNTSYGIFSGEPKHTAVLKFSPERSRWVADEVWHPEQQSAYLLDGSYELRVPYNHSEELIMDILKHGGEVEVLAPGSLKRAVAEELAAALKVYS